jgi:hypothetical protein
MSLSDAMADLVAEVRNGASLEDAAAAIAPDYAFHPSLLVRKFHEAYPQGLPVMADPDELIAMENRIIENEIRARLGMILKLNELLANDSELRKVLRRTCGL